MKLIKSLLLTSILFFGLFIISGCGHSHTFDREVVDEKYFISASSDFEKEKYYKSCSCGAKGTEVFWRGEKTLGNLLAPTNTWYKGKKLRNTITQIQIVNQYTPSGYESEKWDASSTKDKSIICYISGSSLTIYSQEQIYANANSDLLFSGLKTSEYFSSLTTIDGLELIDTSYVISFKSAFDRCQSLEGQLDLSSWDMSKVMYSSAMFQQCGQNAKNPLDIILNSTLTVYDDFIFNHVATYNHRTFTIPSTVTKIGYMHVWYDFGTKIQESNTLENGEYIKDETIVVDNPLFNEFIVEEENEYYKAIDGVLYSKDGKRLISIPCGKKFNNDTFKIPEGVEWINELAFSRTKLIKKIILPNSYTIERFVSPTTHSGKTINQGNSLSISLYSYAYVEEYIVKSENQKYKSIDGCIYSKDGKELIAVPLHYKGDLHMAQGTEEIGEEAWWVDEQVSSKGFISNSMQYAQQITSIHIPESVTNIDNKQLETLNYLLTLRPNIITIDDNNSSYKILNNLITKND